MRIRPFAHWMAAHWRATLDVTASLGMLMAAVLVMALNVQHLGSGGGAPTHAAPPGVIFPAEPVKILPSAIKGTEDAKVVLLAYSDFQCPYCRSFAMNTMPQLEKKYVAPGHLAIVFKHLPIESIHPVAFGAAQAAECAREQGHFWQMHDALFEAQQELRSTNWDSLAKSIGLNVATFQQCVADRSSAVVRADLTLARSLEVTGTPTFFVGIRESDGRVRLVSRLSGDRPLSHFSEVIDPLLLKQRTGG